MKEICRKKRTGREIEVANVVYEMNRRKDIIKNHFYEWNGGNRVELALILKALESFRNGEVAYARPLESAVISQSAVYLTDYLTVC